MDILADRLPIAPWNSETRLHAEVACVKRIPQMCLRISMVVLKGYPYSIYIAQGYHKCAPVITSVSEAPRFKHKLVSSGFSWPWYVQSVVLWNFRGRFPGRNGRSLVWCRDINDETSPGPWVWCSVLQTIVHRPKPQQDLPAHCCQDLQRELASIDIALEAAKNAMASLIWCFQVHSYFPVRGLTKEIIYIEYVWYCLIIALCIQCPQCRSSKGMQVGNYMFLSSSPYKLRYLTPSMVQQ